MKAWTLENMLAGLALAYDVRTVGIRFGERRTPALDVHVELIATGYDGDPKVIGTGVTMAAAAIDAIQQLQVHQQSEVESAERAWKAKLQVSDQIKGLLEDARAEALGEEQS